MPTKERLSVTIDAGLVDAIQRRVNLGEAESVSAWVNDALDRQLGRSARRAALWEWIREYEAEFGVITDEDAAEAWREAKSRAVVVRGRKRKAT